MNSVKNDIKAITTAVSSAAGGIMPTVTSEGNGSQTISLIDRRSDTIRVINAPKDEIDKFTTQLAEVKKGFLKSTAKTGTVLGLTAAFLAGVRTFFKTPKGKGRLFESSIIAMGAGLTMAIVTGAAALFMGSLKANKIQNDFIEKNTK